MPRKISTKLIEFSDGILVEVKALDSQARQISWRLAEKIGENAFDKIKDLLIQACKPIVGAFAEVSSELDIESAEVEFGLGFEAEGNIYITKAKSATNITIKMVVKPKTD